MGPGDQQYLLPASCHGSICPAASGPALPSSASPALPHPPSPLSLFTDQLTAHAQTSPSRCDIVIMRRPSRGYEVLSQMCRSPACLDAPWAPANSCLVLAAALPEGLQGAGCAQGLRAASVWVSVSLLPSSPALELSNSYLYRNKAREASGISHHCLAFCCSLESLGWICQGEKVKRNVNGFGLGLWEF